ncbi:hypothetical protein TVAGG3_0101650, partial [Trichomonas vaginalis G3]|uniref:hypothetical protein n=1 Tax=Trichomonas vaginalis (strain ATCC PRA-98 / G3) TaxID=412133 RepID=UPI0021E5CB6A
MLNVNIDFYYCDPQPEDVDINKVDFPLVESIMIDPEFETVNILLTQSPCGKLHADRITDVEALTGYRVCPYCKEEVYSIRDDPERKNQRRFLKHCEKCKENNGRLIQDVQLQKTQQPYAPHITKQKIYQWLLAHNLQEYYQPTRYYITFDFETLETKEELQLSECATLNAYLKPFMVSSTVKLNDKTYTRNFCLTSSDSFISDWIEFLFSTCSLVAKSNIEQYEELMKSQTDQTAGTLSHTLNEKQKEAFKELLDEEFNKVNIIGFNSGKFDLNLILRDLNTAKW